ncbi:MAG TPA: porin family protein [Arachidicoccus sp.]
MKKLLIGLFAFAATTAFGQVRRGNNVVLQPQFGVFGGLSVANQWIGDSYDGYSDKAKAGGIEGIQLALPISYGWYIQPEVTYSNLGAREWGTFSGNDGSSFTGNMNYNFNYLSVPVLFKYSEPFTGLGILFGPQYGYLLNAKSKPGQSGWEKGTITNDYHRSDLSGVVGLEYYFPNDGHPGAKFGFSMRYQFGFLNVNNGGITYDDGYQPSIRNDAFFLTAGVRF